MTLSISSSLAPLACNLFTISHIPVIVSAVQCFFWKFPFSLRTLSKSSIGSGGVLLHIHKCFSNNKSHIKVWTTETCCTLPQPYYLSSDDITNAFAWSSLATLLSSSILASLLPTNVQFLRHGFKNTIARKYTDRCIIGKCIPVWKSTRTCKPGGIAWFGLISCQSRVGINCSSGSVFSANAKLHTPSSQIRIHSRLILTYWPRARKF